MPDTVLETGDTVMNKEDENLCPIDRPFSSVLEPGFMVASQPGQAFSLILVHNMFLLLF